MLKLPSMRIWDPGQAYYGNPNMVYCTQEQMDDGVLYRAERHLEDYDNLVYMIGTGLYDDNDVEIYEGDIAEFIDYGWNDDEYNCVGEVIFEDGAWHITNAITTSELFNYDGEGIRIIGNIYENPELLEVEK